ncbi:MAG: hypothetical protein KJO41_04445 [Bacteroidia bacterium]|nr:hypothetical protein [Bacteroidia bacterium]MBT8278228.1 hypothetical protein [Bacteroidia bacterium]NNK59024.1 hypothetical protein [Flavobacteriaceae bacterium]NNL31810.1 hypothetical protein [Flavobacteriaceae bacterium]
MNVSKNDLFIIGIALIIGTKLLNFHNVFIVIGILLVYNALNKINKSETEDSENFHNR